MADKLITEPQRTYVLELLTNLGPVADSFVLAGAQALKFLLPKARATRDFDFVLDVVVLREASIPIATILEKLGYVAIRLKDGEFEVPAKFADKKKLHEFRPHLVVDVAASRLKEK